MILYRLAGVSVDVEADDDVLMPLLIVEAERALLGGVRHTVESWLLMDDRERTAWEAAGKRIDLERALLGGKTRDPVGQLEVLNELDPEEAADEGSEMFLKSALLEIAQ